MKLLTAFLIGFSLLSSTNAYAQRGGSFFCIASDHTNNVHYYSDTAKTDPAISTDQYQNSYADALKAQGKSLEPNCMFTDNTDAIPGYISGLKQQCSDCSIWTLQKVAWNPAAPGEKKVAKDDGAPYAVRPNLVQSKPACSSFTEANYRQLALSGEPDTQLKTMCGQAFEFYTMYKRAIQQGYSEADANRTYSAHEGAARNAVSFYENNKAN